MNYGRNINRMAIMELNKSKLKKAFSKQQDIEQSLENNKYYQEVKSRLKKLDNVIHDDLVYDVWADDVLKIRPNDYSSHDHEQDFKIINDMKLKYSHDSNYRMTREDAAELNALWKRYS